MSPTLHTLTHTRRRVLGSAAITMLAARLGMTRSDTGGSPWSATTPD